MEKSVGLKLNLKIDYGLLVRDISILLYFCVMFAHQRESSFETLLRYGSLFFLMVVSLLLNPMKKNRQGNIVWHFCEFEFWMLLLLFYGAISAFWSINPGNIYNVLLNLFKTTLAVFALLPYIRRKEDIDHILKLILLALIYMAILLVIRTPGNVWGSERIGEVIGQHSNEIGRLASLGALLSFYFLTRTNKIFVPYIVPLSIFVMIGFMTGSKNAILIVLFQLAVYWIMISKNWKKIFEILLVAAACALIYRFIMENPVLYQLVGIRVERMIYLFTGGGEVDGSTVERLYFMKTAWRLFKEHPVLGIGLNNFSAYLASIGYSNPVYSHCGFLELLSTLGIPGFCIYYSMHFKVVSRLLKPALDREKLAAALFAFSLRVLIFDFSTISLYTYNVYITLMTAYCFVSMDADNQGKKIRNLK